MNHPDTLQNLIDFEKQTIGFISEPHANKTVSVKITKANIFITIDGNLFVGMAGRQLIHKFGNAIFKTLHEYRKIEFVWNKMIENGQLSKLERKAEHLLRTKPYTIRYFIEQDGTQKIYGIHTDKFVEVNQLDFREEFISVAKESNLLESKSQLGIDPYGNVIEMFPTQFSNDTTDYECILKYGRNNGYSAYQVNYGRIIVICTNGLINLGNSREYKWHHTKKEPIETFVNRVLALGQRNQMDLEEQMQQAALRILEKETLNTFMDNLKTTLIFKQKIRDQITVESKLVGNTEWALSQALTNIATHDKEMDNKTGVKFRNIGTKIITSNLEKINKEAEKWNKKK